MVIHMQRPQRKPPRVLCTQTGHQVHQHCGIQATRPRNRAMHAAPGGRDFHDLSKMGMLVFTNAVPVLRSVDKAAGTEQQADKPAADKAAPTAGNQPDPTEKQPLPGENQVPGQRRIPAELLKKAAGSAAPASADKAGN